MQSRGKQALPQLWAVTLYPYLWTTPLGPASQGLLHFCKQPKLIQGCSFCVGLWQWLLFYSVTCSACPANLPPPHLMVYLARFSALWNHWLCFQNRQPFHFFERTLILPWASTKLSPDSSPLLWVPSLDSPSTIFDLAPLWAFLSFCGMGQSILSQCCHIFLESSLLG